MSTDKIYFHREIKFQYFLVIKKCLIWFYAKIVSLQLIVAVEPEEIPRLENLYKRGQENQVRDLRMIGPEEIKEIEPNCVVRKL